MSSRSCLIILSKCLILFGCTGTMQLPGTVLSDGRNPQKESGHGVQANEVSRKTGESQYEVLGKIYDTMDSSFGYIEIGIASWYGRKFHGRLTAMGEVYDMYSMTAAHKALPLPTMVRVTNLDNGRSIVLRVNDRGPFHDERLIDLSYGGAQALGFENQGTAPVVVEAIDEINYPEFNERDSRQSYYLQAGAFSRLEGAEIQMKKVREALPPELGVRILLSENAESFLHKVWIGPMTSTAEERLISERIEDRNLGKPVRVIIGSD